VALEIDNDMGCKGPSYMEVSCLPLTPGRREANMFKGWWISPLLLVIGFCTWQCFSKVRWVPTTVAVATPDCSPLAQKIIKSMREGQGWELARNNLEHVRHVDADLGVYEDGRVYTVRAVAQITYLSSYDMACIKQEYGRLRYKLEQQMTDKLVTISSGSKKE
jgi:hypothetical protein